MPYEPWMLEAIDQAGYNGIRYEHISAVAAELRHIGLTEIDRNTLETACRRCGVNLGNFTQADLDRLENELNAQ